jgi:hypothetical protein
MATATINWTPVNDVFSVNQSVYYKAFDDADWTLFNTVAPSANTATITGLTDNVIYQFRVRNNCIGGGNTFGNTDEAINITCPTPLTVDPAELTADFSFPHLGGDISSYLVELLSAADAVLDDETITSPGSSVTGTFTGLNPSTDYKIRVTPKATGSQGDYISVCGSISFQTEAVICNPPTGVSAVLS